MVLQCLTAGGTINCHPADLSVRIIDEHYPELIFFYNKAFVTANICNLNHVIYFIFMAPVSVAMNVCSKSSVAIKVYNKNYVAIKVCNKDLVEITTYASMSQK